jgi:hypothetical protein
MNIIELARTLISVAMHVTPSPAPAPEFKPLPTLKGRTMAERLSTIAGNPTTSRVWHYENKPRLRSRRDMGNWRNIIA